MTNLIMFIKNSFHCLIPIKYLKCYWFIIIIFITIDETRWLDVNIGIWSSSQPYLKRILKKEKRNIERGIWQGHQLLLILLIPQFVSGQCHDSWSPYDGRNRWCVGSIWCNPALTPKKVGHTAKTWAPCWRSSEKAIWRIWKCLFIYLELCFVARSK